MKSCLGLIVLFVGLSLALTTGFFVYFPEAPPGTEPRLPDTTVRLNQSLQAGFATGIPAFLAISGLWGIRIRLRERAAIRARAISSEEPADGATQAFVGRLVATGETLVAPLSQRACVMYRYVAEHTSSGKSSTTVEDAEGYALCPTMLHTSCGQFAIRVYLEPEFAKEPMDNDLARARLAEYQRTATLYQQGMDFGQNLKEAQSYLLDDDGAVRYDHGHDGGAARATRFYEQVIANGDEVVIFGKYAAERRAIVPDTEHELMNMARVRKGGVETVSRKFVWEAVGSAAVGLLFFAMTIVVGWAFYTKYLGGY